MSRPYFNNDPRRARLLYHSELWLGTPWCANSDVRGRGVSCHNLPRAIYIECGALHDTFPRVVGDPNATRHSKQSVMEPFLDVCREFQRITTDLAALQPGDLIGLRCFHCCDHLGVCLGNGAFIHVLMHKKTCFDPIAVPPWSQRIVAAWRPMEF